MKHILHCASSSSSLWLRNIIHNLYARIFGLRIISMAQAPLPPVCPRTEGLADDAGLTRRRLISDDVCALCEMRQMRGSMCSAVSRQHTELSFNGRGLGCAGAACACARAVPYWPLAPPLAAHVHRGLSKRNCGRHEGASKTHEAEALLHALPLREIVGGGR
jgi:hypothetical protein